MIDHQTFLQFLQWIENTTGFVLGTYQYPQLQQKLEKIIVKKSLFSLEDYWSLLRENSSAYIEFIHLLVNRETRFFRHPPNYDLLVHLVKTTLDRQPYVNIWSAGCATGEEVYSMLFQLLENDLPPLENGIHILGTDIDQMALDLAQSGIYPKQKWKSLPASLRDKYLSPGKKERTILPDLKTQVRFTPHNLYSSQPVESPWGQWDIVFCRNVLIYFSEEGKTQVLENIYRQMNPRGSLILGVYEFLPSVFPPARLQRCLSHQSYYYQKPPATAAIPIVPPPPLAEPPASAELVPPTPVPEENPPVPPQPSLSSMRDQLAKYLETKQMEPARQLQLEIVEREGETETNLLQLIVLAFTQNDLWEGVEICDRTIQLYPHCTAAHFYLGMILKSLQQLELSLSALQKAASLSNWALPSFYLALAYEKRGQNHQARILFQKVVDTLEQGGTVGKFSPLLDSPLWDKRQIILVARQKLEGK